MVKDKLYKNDTFGQEIPLDPWVSCENSLNLNDPEIPLAARQGKILNEKKLDKVFSAGEPNNYLKLNENMEVVASPVTGDFVDTHTDQTIGGNKTFTYGIVSPQGIMTHDKTGVALTYMNNRGIIAVLRDGQPDGVLHIAAKTVNDPYDAENTTDGSKDAKLTELTNSKLNKTFPDANVGQVMTIDENHNVVPMNPEAGEYVDLVSDQQIAGEKTFLNITKAMGYMSGEVNNGITLTYTQQDEGIIMCSKNGALEGKIKVESKTFSDPYDATNTDVFSKDLKIKEIDDRVTQAEEDIKGKSQVIPGKTEVPGADDIKSLSIDSKFYNLPKPTVEPLYPKQVSPLTVITDLVTSCQSVGQMVILNVSFSVNAGSRGAETVLNDVPQPYETVVNVGNSDCLLSINRTDVTVVVPNGEQKARSFNFNVCYAKYQG